LNFFGLFDECLCIHCFGCSLVSIFTNKSQVSLPVTHMMWQKLLPSQWYRFEKSQSQRHSLWFLCAR
jgi:hypothetical protein